MPAKFMECGPKCRSRRHAYDINAAITKGNLQAAQSYSKLCYNGTQLCDMYGRSALHMAASCGKVDMVEWLLEEMHGDVTQKDKESGWTALHRAVFYGQLATARLLLQFKSDLYTRDHEGLGPLDIAMKDRKLIPNVLPYAGVLQYGLTSVQQEVCTWGDNSNFTLGHSTEHGRQAPEVVDIFRKQHVAIKQIVMCKYHTVFLTSTGQVYTCGHGMGGRLGHHTEETCLVPRLVEAFKSDKVTEIVASRDHTLFLSESGTVYSCGWNDSHQLGQQPVQEKCLVPRSVNCKVIKGKTVLGLGAGRCHSLVYTSSMVYTCGLNAGQLGHPKMKGDRKNSQLKQVSALNVKDLHIVSVKSSDAATVVLTKEGEMYVLHEYQCRKIASNRPDVLNLFVVGGNLDHTDSQILRENGGRELIISYLNSSGMIFIWHEKSPSLKRANWLIRRQLQVTDFTLSENGMAIVTEEGEVFVCTMLNKPPPTAKDNVSHTNKESIEGEFGRMSLMELLSKEEVEDVQIRRVPNVHRAVYVTADRKGHNYATLQTTPNTCLTDVPEIRKSEMVECYSKLLDEVDEYDLIHDLILQVHDQRWPVHKFIMVSRCANFPNLLVNSTQTNNEMDVSVIELTDIHPQILEQVLQYVYTDSCELLTIGAHFVLSDVDKGSTNAKQEDIFHLDLGEGNGGDSYIDGRKSAYQVVQNQSKGKKGKQDKEKHQQQSHVDPIKLLLDIARKWGVKDLVKRIGCVGFQKGQVIKSAGKKIPKTSLKFDRNKLRDTKWELYDVQVKSEDGILFHCHRCVLVARLEYFHSMLATGWMETSSESALSLAVPGDILEILLEYLYTDDSQVVNGSQNVELLCNILVVADQMLVTRLKEMCEAAVAGLLTLKNVCELLEFSSMYNAGQLKAACSQFIVINLPAMLETRYLDVLSEDVIDRLSQYYRNLIPNMSRRMITPYDEGPDRRFLEALAGESQDIGENIPSGASFDQKKSKSKRRRHRTKSSADDIDKVNERGPRRVSETERGFEKMAERGPIMGNEKSTAGVGQKSISGRHLSICSDISVKSDEDLECSPEKGLNIDCTAETKDLKSPDGPGSAWDETKSPTSPRHTVWTHKSRPSPSVTVTSNNNSNNNNNDNSISGTPSGPSLRDIMCEEQNRTTPAKSSQRGKKFSWKDVKKQQQHTQQKSHVETTVIEEKELNNNALPKVCPWGSTNSEVKSFRSLMQDQQTTSQLKTKPQSPGKTANQSKQPQSQGKTANQSKLAKTPTQSLSWGLLSSTKSAPVSTPKVQITSGIVTKTAWGPSPTSPQSPDNNPWTGASVAQSPPDNVCSFSEIIRHEQRKTDVLTKTTNKPLSLIQVEEQAIHDLLQYYKASSTVDEHISVERVTHEAAVPVWKRERLQSS